MKSIRNVIAGLALLATAGILHAQTDFGNFNASGSFNNLAPGQSSTPDDIVQITAEAEGLIQADPTTLPLFASCWWTVFPGGGPVPMPCPPQDMTVPIYEIAPGSGIYLVDETGGAVSVSAAQTEGTRATTGSAVSAAVERQGNAIADLIEQVQETQFEQTMSMAFGMDVPMPGDGGGGTNSYTPDGSGFALPDYGTNLWIAQTAVAAGNLTGIGSNTVADVQYEIQSRTNLAQIDWQSEGFIYGSEVTNWTALSVPQIGRTNLFIRLKSWADDGSGLPIWWQMEYFGYVGVDPNGDPEGDGWSNIQKFQNGWNPLVFHQPAAPQGVTVTYDTSNGNATMSWLPSPGTVTSYTVTDSDGHTFTLAASDTSVTDDISGDLPDPDNDGNIDTTMDLTANYGTNGSASTGQIPVLTNPINGFVLSGAQGDAYLMVSGLPTGTSAVRFQEIDQSTYLSGPVTITNYDIPITAFTNGVCILPNTFIMQQGDFLGAQPYSCFGQAVEGLAERGNVVSVSVRSAGRKSGDGVWAEVQEIGNKGGDVAQLPVRLGGAGEDGRLSGTVRPGGVRT